MNEDLKRALAWVLDKGQAASDWSSQTLNQAKAAAQWVWEVLQGDFNDNQNLSHVAANTGLSIALTATGVGVLAAWLLDLRDFCANCIKVSKEPDNNWHWLGLVLTLLGVVPVLGDLGKGVLRIAVIYLRRFGALTGKSLKLNPAKLKLALEYAIIQVRHVLADERVLKLLHKWRWDQPYKKLADITRELRGKATKAEMMQQFDRLANGVKDIIGSASKYLPAGMRKKADELIQLINRVRNQLNQKVDDALRPAKEFLEAWEKRLLLENANKYRAQVGAVNPHYHGQTSADADAALIQLEQPKWAGKGELPYEGLGKQAIAEYKAKAAPKIKKGWPNLSNQDIQSFHGDIRADTLPAGTKLVRIIGPENGAGGLFWMTRAEFDKLNAAKFPKTEWRKRYAVWPNWNPDGQYVTYTVPEGGQKVWRGTIASQELKNNPGITLEGGAEQIVFYPGKDDFKEINGRKFREKINDPHIQGPFETGWGYTDFAGQLSDKVAIPLNEAQAIKGQPSGKKK